MNRKNQPTQKQKNSQEVISKIDTKVPIISIQEKSSHLILNAVYKRIRNLNKKLLNIQLIEKQPVDTLLQDQIKKIQRKQQTINEIKKNQEFALFYKNVLQQNNGQAFDSTDLLTRIATLIAVGQYMDRNKGLLFKPQISDDFKKIYEKSCKVINYSNENEKIQTRIKNILKVLTEFTKNDKSNDVCKQFITHCASDKKQEIPIAEQKKISNTQNQRPLKIRKNTVNRNWADNTSDQDEEASQTVKIVENQTKLPLKKQEVKQVVKQKLTNQLLIKPKQQKTPQVSEPIKIVKSKPTYKQKKTQVKVQQKIQKKNQQINQQTNNAKSKQDNQIQNNNHYQSVNYKQYNNQNGTTDRGYNPNYNKNYQYYQKTYNGSKHQSKFEPKYQQKYEKRHEPRYEPRYQQRYQLKKPVYTTNEQPIIREYHKKPYQKKVYAQLPSKAKQYHRRDSDTSLQATPQKIHREKPKYVQKRND